MTHLKIAMCLPWYAGSDQDTVANNLSFQHYLGRLRERADWLSELDGHGPDLDNREIPLDPHNTTGWSEKIPRNTTFEFGIADQIGCSLVGMARDKAVDDALEWGADRILMWDDDMLFGTDIFLRLLAADKPLVAALAFTGRVPTLPVIYSFHEFDSGPTGIQVRIEPVLNYKRNALQQVDAVGFGMVMIKSEVFRAIPKPWFNNPGVGEDIQFCLRMKQHDLGVWVDTAAKTIHKPTVHAKWHDELYFDRQQAGYCPHCGEKKTGAPAP